MSSIEFSVSKSVISSKFPTPAKLIDPVPESNPILVFAP